MSRGFIALEHPRFHRAQRDIFVCRVTPDCMNHTCKLLKDDSRTKLDACCQYGVDADLAERDGILAHADQIRSLLDEDARDRPWFKDTVSHDADFPSGAFVRTNTHTTTGTGRPEQGCIFLAHDGRGCAIHRASIEGGWKFEGVKPHVCRLFPLSYDAEAIVMSDDYADYSCSLDADAPSVYRVAREVIEEIFGVELIVALDAAEAVVMASDEVRAGSPVLHTLASRTP